MLKLVGRHCLNHAEIWAHTLANLMNNSLTVSHCLRSVKKSSSQRISLSLCQHGGAWVSPYINRFLQPDSIIPNPANPQSLNRFGYVLNNPIRFNDPSGHVCSDPDDLWSPGCDGDGGPPTNIPAPLPSGPVVITNPDPLDDGLNMDDDCNCGVTPEVEESDGWEFWDFWGWYVKGSLQFLDYLSSIEDVLISGTPLYRQVKWGINTGPIEGIADGFLYGLKDRWISSLSPGQRVARMTVVGLQSLLVDVVSNKVGTYGRPFGGKAGEIAVQYIFSSSVSRFILPTTTYWTFDALNLGLPQDISPIR
jgi:RHS repeat-associated protein